MRLTISPQVRYICKENMYSAVADWHILQKVVLASIRCFIGVYGI